MENKEIRFVDSKYKELFRIPDGGSITIKYRNGDTENRVCKYIDDYHLYVGNNCFHICEFAELMERNGSTYTPAKKDIGIGTKKGKTHKNKDRER